MARFIIRFIIKSFDAKSTICAKASNPRQSTHPSLTYVLVSLGCNERFALFVRRASLYEMVSHSLNISVTNRICNFPLSLFQLNFNCRLKVLKFRLACFILVFCMARFFVLSPVSGGIYLGLLAVVRYFARVELCETSC